MLYDLWYTTLTDCLTQTEAQNDVPLPDYLLTNYYENRFPQLPPPLAPILLENYVLLHEIRLLDETIYTVYTLRK